MRLAVLASILLLWAMPAHAATVALVRPLGTTPELTETLVRLHGELLSVGFAVRLLDRPAGTQPGGTEPQPWLEALAAEGENDAVVEVVGDATTLAVDLWILSPAPQRLDVVRVELEPTATNRAERLAIRAVEVLRSTFLEQDMAARRRQAEALQEPGPATPPPVALGEPAERPERVGVAVGLAGLTSLDGVGPAVLPMARLDWAARPWLVTQAALAGLGSRPEVATTAGTARVAQQYGTLGGRLRLRSESRLTPFVALSSGVLRTSVEGQAEAPRQGQGAEQWSLLLDGSVGAELHLPERYSLTLAGHAQWAEPYVAIHFVDSVVATTGRPNLALSLTVGVWP